MPCYVTGSAEGDARLSAAEAHERATELARMLCTICEQVEDEGGTEDDIKDPSVRAWWRKHKKIDEVRRTVEALDKRRQRAKQAALAKLSTEEREALGLKD